MSRSLLGAVEAGGTKMVCAVAYDPNEILDEVRFPTRDPAATLSEVEQYFRRMEDRYESIQSIGYGTFGPAAVHSSSADYGKILNTPKVGWQQVNVLGFLSESFPEARLAFDTDVNAAALGEGYAGAGRGFQNYIYVTVGTGIGGGVVIGGKPLHANPHAEIGHMLVPDMSLESSDFKGVCPFHGRCLEGVASGLAMTERWGVSPEQLAHDHQAWVIEARYLAAMIQNLMACYAPDKIILGGGVMEQEFLLDMIQSEFDQLAGGYWQYPEDLIVRPELGNQSGITGALLMALTA